MADKKKELKQAYKENPPAMGAYQIRNLANNKVLVGTTPNLPGAFNSQRFQLSMGNHRNKALQSEWHEFGSHNFVFETLDELKPTEGPDHDYRADLAFLEKFWLESLQPFGERGYNEVKKGREERLQQIIQNRSQ